MLLSSLLFLVIGILTTVVYAQENTTDIAEPKFFAIQHANSGSIAEINATAYSLVLNDVSDKTILLSDRPNRIVTSMSTSNFVGNWTIGEDNFAVNPPNTVLVVDEQEGNQDISIVELFNPIYDVDKKTLKYKVIPDNDTSIDLPSEYEKITLFLDIVPPHTCAPPPPLDLKPKWMKVC